MKYDKLGILLGMNPKLDLELIEKIRNYYYFITITSIDDKEYLLIPFLQYLRNRDKNINRFISNRYTCFKISEDNNIEKIQIKSLFKIIKFDISYSQMSINNHEYFLITKVDEYNSYELIGRYINTQLRKELSLARSIGIFRDNNELEHYIDLIQY